MRQEVNNGKTILGHHLSLSFSFFLSSFLTLHFTSLHKEPEGQKTERRASNTDDRKSLLPGSHRRFSKTGRTSTTIVLREPGQQWTHEASEIAVERPRLTGSTTNGDNHWISKSCFRELIANISSSNSEAARFRTNINTLRNIHQWKSHSENYLSSPGCDRAHKLLAEWLKPRRSLCVAWTVSLACHSDGAWDNQKWLALGHTSNSDHK